MDDAPPWSQDGPAAPQRRRRQGLIALATLPWLLVGALVVQDRDRTAPTTPPTAAITELGADDDHHPIGDHHPVGAEEGAAADAGQEPADASPVDAHASETGTATSPTTATPHDTDPPATRSVPGSETTTPRVTDGDAVTVATAVARAWLSDQGGPGLEGPGVDATDAGYLEHVSVRRIEVLGARRAVVTLGVLLLERDGDRYTRVRAADLLVPLTLGSDRVHPAGTPWWSPQEIDLRPQPPEVDDEASSAVTAEVVAALAEAGYRDVQVAAVAHGGDDLLVATVRAETPDGRRLDGDLWLRETPDGPHVLGVEP